jgi:hypothetical protein
MDQKAPGTHTGKKMPYRDRGMGAAIRRHHGYDNRPCTPRHRSVAALPSQVYIFLCIFGLLRWESLAGGHKKRAEMYKSRLAAKRQARSEPDVLSRDLPPEAAKLPLR